MLWILTGYCLPINPDTRRALEEEARIALDARYGAGAFDRIFEDREE